MNETDVLEVSREALTVALTMTLPVMMVAMVVGLIIGLFQALTQIQEMTLTFVPKIVALFIALLLLGPFMYSTLRTFTETLADRIVAGG